MPEVTEPVIDRPSRDVPQPESLLGRFGLSEFRPGQRDVIQAVLDNRDCLCIMPTGGGKSLCFQLPAVLREGVVLVISPLIALMKDQVDGLQRIGLRATFINSSLGPAEQHERLQLMAAGEFDLVYVAPERLRSPRFLESLRQVRLQLLAIDEAHCISEWGHDFRPDYTRIGKFRERLGWPQTIALTATATPDVRLDVIAQLQLRSTEVFITGFARPNLRFEVYAPADTKDKNDKLAELIAETPGAALVYAATRKRCEELVEMLGQRLDRRVAVYHAGLMPDDRRRVQDDFMSGRTPVIVATNAFGMGIDKRDLRLVVHYNLPGTLEAYYQEAGRAGRDGQSARCVLLYSYADRYIQEFFIDNRYPERDVVAKVYEFLRGRSEDPIELTLQQIKDSLGLSITSEGVGTCEQVLEKAGAIERLDSKQNMASIKIDSDLPTLVDLLPKEAKTQRKVLRALEQEVGDLRGEWVFLQIGPLLAALELDREAFNRALRELTRLEAVDYVAPFRGRAVHLLKRDTPFAKLEIDFAELARHKALDLDKLERVIAYAETRRCRQLEILDYFGDPQRKRCHVCDNCSPTAPITHEAPSELALDATISEPVRMVLSGAARARERIGKGLLAKMLAGSNSSQMKKLRLDELSTFGLLADLRQTDVADLVEACIEARLLTHFDLDRFRAVLQLTELGHEVMRGQAPLPTRFSIKKELLAALRARRRTPNPTTGLAKKPDFPSAPSVPAMHVELVRRDDPPTPSENSEASPSTELPAGLAERPAHYWTWRLLSDGYSMAVCRAIRGLDDKTLREHLQRAERDGLPVDSDWLNKSGPTVE